MGILVLLLYFGLYIQDRRMNFFTYCKQWIWYDRSWYEINNLHRTYGLGPLLFYKEQTDTDKIYIGKE